MRVGVVMNRQRLLIGWLASVVAGVGAAYGQSPAQRISGEVVSLEGVSLQIKANDGQPMTVTLADNLRLSARSIAQPGKLVPGAYVGTTAVPRPDGTLTALEVHVFPESMRGTGEGHRPTDSAPGGTMTNATIRGIAGGERGRDDKAGGTGTMTDAPIAQLRDDVHGRRMTLAYKGGEKVVVVPDDTPIVMVEVADRSLLVPGAHVVAYVTRQPDGTLTAERLTVGKNGFTPPM